MFYYSVSANRTMEVPVQITNSPRILRKQHAEAALMDLQTAIVRLSCKPLGRPGVQPRQELSALVEQALAAYRKYMEATAA